MERKMCSWSFWLTKDGGLCVCAWESETYWDINILHPFLVPQSPIRNPKSRLKKENKSTLAICIVLFVWHLAFPDANEPMTYTQIDKLWCDACINISLCICIYNNIYITVYEISRIYNIICRIYRRTWLLCIMYYVFLLGKRHWPYSFCYYFGRWFLPQHANLQRFGVAKKFQNEPRWWGNGMGWDGMDMGVSKKLGGFPQNGWWK